MRFVLLFALSLSCIGTCRAASPTSLPALPESKNGPITGTSKVLEQRSEKIHIEDADSSIDELRVGGETKSIKVQPKGGLPAYEIAPSSGERSWKVLSF